MPTTIMFTSTARPAPHTTQDLALARLIANADPFQPARCRAPRATGWWLAQFAAQQASL